MGSERVGECKSHGGNQGVDREDDVTGISGSQPGGAPVDDNGKGGEDRAEGGHLGGGMHPGIDIGEPEQSDNAEGVEEGPHRKAGEYQYVGDHVRVHPRCIWR